ncbi:MAG: 1-acyl-sn-glycerol-3-phosphate acyltransferase [Candidatus Hydrogenedentes bacterium]|nr:1-acyl-sn-glycerol-3-phosphate acyltransferase [Candidatus Hydrogenedentota bacterium]
MGTIRLLVRFPLGLLWTLVLWSIRLAFYPISWYSESTDRRWRRAIVRAWGYGFCPLIGMRVEIKGKVPEPPYFLVANHLSYIDIWLLANSLGCVFVSRGDVKHWPVIGPLSRSIHVIFIDREDRSDTVRVNEEIHHALAQGDGVAIFPEGHIYCGLEVGPFNPALIQPAVANELPVHYASISYETSPGSLPASRCIAWFRPEPFGFHMFRLLRQPGFTATIHFGGAPVVDTDRKRLARALQQAVNAQFVPLT